MEALEALAYAVKLRATLRTRAAEVETEWAYYRGEHPLAYASDEWSQAHRERYRGFSDNWCGVVGSAPAQRLEVRGFQIAPGEATDWDKKLWRDWEVNDGPALSAQGFLASTIAKRSFASVWGTSDDEPTLAWESPAEMIVDYDAETRVEKAAVKCWSDDKTEYLTLYLPDAVWKWSRPSSQDALKPRKNQSAFMADANDLRQWEPRQAAADDTWPIENPLGVVPITEYPNRPMLGGQPMSDIDATISMQNAVNLLWAYLFVAADYASMPARVVLGQEPPVVPKLNERGEKVGDIPVDQESLKKGRMLWFTGQATKIDQWSASTLDVFTDVVNVAVRHIATQTSTPIYLIHGEMGNINGETLAGLDAPLVSKVGWAQKFYQRSVRRTFGLMALARGENAVYEASRAGIVDWADPATHSPAQLSDAALKSRQLGLPLSEILRRYYDYTEPEIERIAAEVQAEQSDPYLRQIDAKSAAGV